VTEANAQAALDCRDIRKRFHSTVALQGITLAVPRGSIFGFLGPNGAGKSTLVKILTGLVHPDSGDVTVLGNKPGSRAAQRDIGYLPEHFRFPGWLTATELLGFHGRLLGVPVDTDRLLGLVGLTEAADRRVAELSKGMQQRLGLAQALVGEPELVFLDEPTSALLTEVEKICDRVAVIDRGSVVAMGSMDELLQGPAARIEVGALAPEMVDTAVRALAAAGAGGGSYQSGVLTVPVASRDDLPLVVVTIVGLGIPVYEAGLVRRSLEDAFVQLVREHESGRSEGVA
jgi:ABC-2 type transport system ATP-binding protein